MRSLKSVSSLLLVLVLLISVCAVGAEAEAGQVETEGSTFRDNSNFIQDYRPVPNGLLIYYAAQGELPTSNAFSVRLGDKDLAVLDVGTTKDDPVTYYCLVDVSGSVTSVQLLCARQMLHSLCDSLRAGDQMVIATVGNERRASAYLRDPLIIHQKIDEIISTNEDTNLYRAITESLEELDTGRDATNRKCLVVFSDGIDDATAEAGRTRQEAERKIEETRIPFYCMLPPSDKKDAGKTLGSFARLSAGGEAYYLAERILTEEEIGQAIAENMKGDLILSTDLTGYTPQSDEQLLTVGYTDKIGIFYGDSINVVSSNLLLGEAALDDPGSSAALESPEPEEGSDSSEEKEKYPKWLIPAIAGGGFALVILIVILVNSKQQEEKKRKQKLEEQRRLREQQPWQREQQPWQREQQPWQREQAQRSSRGETATVGRAEERDRLGQPIESGGKPVRFTTVGNQSFSTEVLLQEGRKVTVGRNRKADVILNKDDTKLSGVHFGLLLENNTLRIWDMGSTNGTSVNGVPLVGNSVQIRSGETVTAGSYQYRIQF